MKQFFEKIWNFAKQYPWSTFDICLSFILSIGAIYLSLWGWNPLLDGWQPVKYIFIGLLPVILFSLIMYLVFKKNQQVIIDKKKMSLFNIAFLFISLQIIFLVIMCLFASDDVTRTKLNSPKRYNEIINCMQYKNIREIFPKSIPTDAKNVKVSGHQSLPGICYYEKLELSFIAPEDYINKEKNRLKEIKPEINTIHNKHVTCTVTGDYISVERAKELKKDVTQLYDNMLISKREYPDENHQNYFYCGYSIDKKTNRISYTYSAFYGDYCDGCYKYCVKKGKTK